MATPAALGVAAVAGREKSSRLPSTRFRRRELAEPIAAYAVALVRATRTRPTFRTARRRAARPCLPSPPGPALRSTDGTMSFRMTSRCSHAGAAPSRAAVAGRGNRRPPVDEVLAAIVEAIPVTAVVTVEKRMIYPTEPPCSRPAGNPGFAGTAHVPPPAVARAGLAWSACRWRLGLRIWAWA